MFLTLPLGSSGGNGHLLLRDEPDILSIKPFEESLIFR